MEGGEQNKNTPFVWQSKNGDVESCIENQVEADLEHLTIDCRNASENDKIVCVENKIGRGLSVVNSDIVSRARNVVEERDVLDSCGNEYIEESPNYTFVLPNLSQYSNDFAEFLKRDLIETSSLVSLEQGGFLNWWAEKGSCQKLWPIVTSGDGNCLLHAASLGMWGFHDRLLTLRKAMHRVLLSKLTCTKLRRRWQWQLWLRNLDIGGLVYSEKEWESEWNEVLRIASADPRPKSCSLQADRSSQAGSAALECIPENVQSCVLDNNQPDTKESQGIRKRAISFDSPPRYESLEEIHIFVLAHVLRRPIVVVADTMLRGFDGEPIAPIPFGGVYLPLECPHEKCYKNPLVLAFDSAHFSALVPMETSQIENQEKLITAIPLVGADYELLTLHFAVDPGPNFRWDNHAKSSEIIKQFELGTHEKLELLHKYLDVVYIPPPRTNVTETLEYRTQETDETNDLRSEDSSRTDSSETPSTKKDKTKKTFNKYIDKCKDFIVQAKDDDVKHKFEKNKENFAENVDQIKCGSKKGSVDSSLLDSFAVSIATKDKKSEDKKENEMKWFGSLKMRRPSLTREKVTEVIEEPTKEKPVIQDISSDLPREDLTRRPNCVCKDNGETGLKLSLQNCLMDIGKVVSAVARTSQSDQTSILSARLLTDKRPVYYQEMIKNYISSAKRRYEVEKNSKRSDLLNTSSPIPCVNPGCNMYGTHVTSYLCTSCHKVQQKLQTDSVSRTSQGAVLDPYDALPSYDTNIKETGYDSKRFGIRGENIQQCLSSNCTFYGTQATQGYCSTCFKKLK